MPKPAIGMFTVLVVIAGLGISGNANAQDSALTLPQAIERAKENYPAIKAAQLEVDKQEALKATAYELGTTSIYTGKEEVGNNAPGIQNKIGIGQSDIDVFGIPAKNNLANCRTQQALSGQKLTEYSLARDVSHRLVQCGLCKTTMAAI